MVPPDDLAAVRPSERDGVIDDTAQPALSLERARQIARDLIAVYIPRQMTPAIIERLRGYELRDMLQAMRVLCAEGERERNAAHAGAQGGPVSYSLYATVADRSIAALYALLHHEASDPAELVPVLVLGDVALGVLRLPPRWSEDDAVNTNEVTR